MNDSPNGRVPSIPDEVLLRANEQYQRTLAAYEKFRRTARALHVFLEHASVPKPGDIEMPPAQPKGPIH